MVQSKALAQRIWRRYDDDDPSRGQGGMLLEARNMYIYRSRLLVAWLIFLGWLVASSSSSSSCGSGNSS